MYAEIVVQYHMWTWIKVNFKESSDSEEQDGDG